MEGERSNEEKAGGTAQPSAGSENLGSKPEVGKPPTNSNPPIQRSVEESMNAVFSNDMLREIIVAQVIQNEVARGYSRDDVRAVRRVAKSWLLDANKYLLATGQPLIKIELTHENSLNDSSQVQRNGGKILDRFMRAMDSPTGVETETPPLSIRIRPDFLREENRQSFSNFLARLGPGLVGLHIAFPKNGGSMNLLFPRVNLAFPHLRKFKVAFPPAETSLGEEEDDRSCSWSNIIALPFIQSILNGSEKLREFRFPFIGDMVSYIPYDIRFLYLPPTITFLDVESFVESSEFEALFNFDLPNLHTLTFCILDEPYAEGLLSRILEKFRASLRTLRLRNTGSDSPQHPPHLFRFPRMEKLKTCYFRCRFVELEEGHPPLQNSLPNLEKLVLENQTTAMMQKWTEFSTFPNVHTLTLKLIDRPPPLSTAFPTLESLFLTFKAGVDFAWMNDALLEMPQLIDLYIILCDGTEVGSTEEWDSFFTGIPVAMVKSIRGNPDLIKMAIKRLEKLPQASIQQMSRLDLLSLVCENGVEQEPLISMSVKIEPVLEF